MRRIVTDIPRQWSKVGASAGLHHEIATFNPLVSACKHHFDNAHFTADVHAMAASIRRAEQNRRLIEPGTPERRHFQQLTQSEAYTVAAASSALRTAEKQTFPVGRKIGFTNKNIWSEYNIDASNWGYMYDDTVTICQPTTRRTILMEETELRLNPKIEPEIVFGMKSAPRASMTDLQLVACIDWVASGIEVVHSIYPDWKFTAPETTATGALHSQLIIEKMVKLCPDRTDGPKLIDSLADLTVKLYCNDKLVDEGRGSNVLGNPINALRHLCKLLEKQDLHPEVHSGEIITTGTITRAWPIAHGDTWRAEYKETKFERLKAAIGTGDCPKGGSVEFLFCHPAEE